MRSLSMYGATPGCRGIDRAMKAFSVGGPCRRSLSEGVPQILYYQIYRGFGLLPRPKVLDVVPLGATLKLRRCPKPLGPPQGHMPGHPSSNRHLRGPIGSSSSPRQTCLSLDFELVSSSSSAPTRDDAELPCCRSLAGRLPLDLGEAVGRAARSVRRPQLHGQLDMHGINYHRGRDAEKAWKVGWLP